MPKRITIKEIASKAEVSIGTVDRVLHNRGRVAQATKDKILEIAKKGNYSSNIYARNLKLNRTYKVAVVLSNDNPYWDKHRVGIKRALNEYEAMGFTQREIEVTSLNEETRASAIKQALESDADGVVLSPNMLSRDGAGAKMLSETKIPFVFVDATMEQMNNLSFIGQDTYQSGTMAGKILSNAYDNYFCIWVVTQSASDLQKMTIIKRIEGLEAFFQTTKKHINISKVNLETDGLTMAELKAQLLKESKPVHLFIPHSKSYTILDEIHPIRKQCNMRIIGYDLIDSNIKCLKNGWIDYLIDQQPIKQGYLAIQALYKHLILKSDVAKNQYLPLDIITKENLMYCDY
ncbi:MAG: LacI family DNA-binding transcriptional regulator [Reichenbachiella sp.]|uniref:LacI family DNA-binding transcriptional regulator n=1 Tax=Reichenbachiella sp. TaxID=2184521 RepID=UPI00329757CB